MNTMINNTSDHFFIQKGFYWLFTAVLLLAGCGGGEGDGGDNSTDLTLPTDNSALIRLHCDDMGIFEEDCVLDDPDNPYRNSPISEMSKFELAGDAPSLVAEFYVWATALARGAGAAGENQFYVALKLHQIWGVNGEEVIRNQALRAYRSYLDNYFGSTTVFEFGDNSSRQSLNEFVGQLLFDPTNLDNTFTAPNLFNTDPNENRTQATSTVSDWGYTYLPGLEDFLEPN